MVKASFCIPFENSASGSAWASPRNTWAVQYCLYALSDMPSNFNRTTRSYAPGARTNNLTGTPPAQECFSPAKSLRSSGVLKLVTGFFSLTTTATALVCATAMERPVRPASEIATQTTISLVCIKSCSKRECQLQMQAIQVGLAFPLCVIQLGLDSNGVVEIVARTK